MKVQFIAGVIVHQVKRLVHAPQSRKVCIVRSVVSKLLFEMRLDETEIRDGKKRDGILDDMYRERCRQTEIDRERGKIRILIPILEIE